jgi:hypothetical protein
MAVLACLVGSTGSSADVVELHNGWHFRGEAVERTDKVVRWKLSDGKVVEIATHEIKSIRRDEKLFIEATRRRQLLEYTDCDGHYSLASWCLERGLLEPGRELLAHVLELDPNHAAARSMLGYQLIDGQWLDQEAAQRARGLIQHRGVWMTPEQAETDRQLRLRLASSSCPATTRRRAQDLIDLMSHEQPDVRKRAHELLLGLAQREQLKDLIEVAGQLDRNWRAIRGDSGGRYVTTDIRVTRAGVTTPIPTRELGLGGTSGRQVNIQLPVVDLIQVETTTMIPTR